jgi:hypothetical protein
MIKCNRFGRFKKDDLINNQYQILDDEQAEGLDTATGINEFLGIKLTTEQKLKHCEGFVCKREWRGCVPVFDVSKMWFKKEKGEL